MVLSVCLVSLPTYLSLLTCSRHHYLMLLQPLLKRGFLFEFYKPTNAHLYTNRLLI